VVFTLCFVVTVAHLYVANVDTVAANLGGRAALEVTSNAAQPVPAPDVAQLPGVTKVTGASATDVRVLTAGSDAFRDVTLVGIGADGALIDHGTPPIVATAAGVPKAAVYQRVASDPTLVVVGADADTSAQNSLDHRAPRVGDTLELSDPVTGRVRPVRVAGLVANARYEGVDHIYASESLAAQLHGAPPAQNLLFVETAPGTNNDTVSAVIDGTHLENGTYARSFHRLAEDRLGAQQQFLDILGGYAALGLISGAIALAVAMIDRVRERSRQLAMLRAIGCRPSVLRRALRIEAAIIGIGATLAGALTATLLAWRVATTGALGQALTFTAPDATLALIVVAVVLSAIGAATVAARRAGRLEPAGALRAEE
jgi:putative ABC transport system permease protein